MVFPQAGLLVKQVNIDNSGYQTPESRFATGLLGRHEHRLTHDDADAPLLQAQRPGHQRLAAGHHLPCGGGLGRMLQVIEAQRGFVAGKRIHQGNHHVRRARNVAQGVAGIDQAP